jgi:signal transduction histidine kinase
MTNELAILVLMTNPADVRVISRLLQQSGMAFMACEDLAALLAEAGRGGGLLLLAEEAMAAPGSVAMLNAHLDRQPPWSELPVILLGRNLQASPGERKKWPQLIRNLTLVNRPIASASLISILQTGLQARRRQYEVRDLLAALRDLNENLERRVAVRTDELEQRTVEVERLATELRRSNQELEQFAYIASHDLQAPLRSVSGFLDLLARRYQGRLGADADEFIGFAVDGVARMQQLIHDILAFSRVGSRANPPEQLASREPLDRALGNLKTDIEESRAEIKVEPLPPVTGDRNQLAQLFQNLVGNAIKYRKPGEPPHISISAEEKESEWEFRVRDNGIGIDPRFAERIFQIFQRLHTTGEYSGTGIGLAICKKIVERHGGRIWVESEPGQGSTFSFTLPKR